MKWKIFMRSLYPIKKPSSNSKSAGKRGTPLIMDFSKNDFKIQEYVSDILINELLKITQLDFYLRFVLTHFPFRAPEKLYKKCQYDKINLYEIPSWHLKAFHPVIHSIRKHFEVDEQIREDAFRK